MLQGYFEQTGSSKLVATTDAASATISKGISKIGKIPLAVASIGAAIVALKALDEKFDITFDTAFKHTSEGVSNVQNLKSEIDSLNSQTEQYKQTLSDIASSNNIDISGLDSVDDIVNKINSVGGISLVDQTEVDKISTANASLERTLELKNLALTSEQKEAADKAKKTLEKEVSAQAYDSDFKLRTKYEENYVGMPKQRKYQSGNLIQSISSDMKAIDDYKKTIDDLQNQQLEAEKVEEKQKDKKWYQYHLTDFFKKKDSEKLQTQIDDYTKEMDKIQSEVDDKQTELQTLLSAFSVNGEGLKALPGYESWFNQVNNMLTQISTSGKSASEKALASLNAFFDGSISKKAILNQLKEANKSGKDLEETLNMMGLSLSDLGIDNIKYLASYLQEASESADEAKESVQDYATTVSDVKTATESANQDSDWSTIQSAYKSAKDLLTEGKTGTDDFQSMASFLNPKKVKEYAEQGGKYTADAYQKAFEEIKATADRWFGDDETASMENFVNDFKDKGLWNVSTDAMGLWDIQKNFKTTAEAADKFGISVNAVETMLHGLEAYGYDFSDIMFSGEGLDKFKTSLESIKTIQKSLSDGASKDRLGKLIDNWDSEVQGYENDMSKLTEDKIVKIQFEYDLAQIQQEIDKLQRVADEGGDSQTWAELNATKKAYLEKSESREGNHITDVTEYKNASDTVLAFRQQLKNASPEVKEQIQEQISAIYDLQKAANDAFADSGMAWDDWISSKDGKAIFSNMQSSIADIKQQIADALGIDVDDIKIDIDADTSKAEDKINGLVSDDGKTIIMNVDASTDEIQQQLNTLKEGQTLYFTANVDNVPAGVAAVREQDGTISYIGVDNGVQVYLQQVKNADGTISYTVGDVPQEVPEAKQVVMREPDNSGVSSNPSSVGQSVVRTADNSGVSSNLPTIFQKVVRFFTGGDKLYGSAHLDGTLGGIHPIPKLSARALAMGTLQDTSFLRDSWQTAQNEVALTGEKGPEIVIPPHSNRWYTVGDQGAEFAAIPAGSTVFNSKQSKELLTKGKTNSRAKGNPSLPGLPSSMAFLQGTAYRLGNYSGSGTSKNNYTGSSGTSAGNTSNNNTNTSNTNSDTSSKAEETKETLDWIETELDRIKRNIDLVDKTASSTYKNWSKRNEALASELSQVSNELNVQQQAYDRYMQQANSVGLSEDWASKVRDGRIDIETITDSDLKDKISDYKTWYEKALDCRDAIADLREQESKLYEQKFNNLKDEYDAILDQFDHTQKMLEGYIDLTEAQGYISSSKYYDALIENENEKLKNLTSKRDDLINSLNEALASGKIDKYSESWYSMQQEINSVDEAILDCNKNTVEWGNNIRQIGWDIFDKLEDRISDITDEADFLVDLMSSEKMYDDKNGGTITDYGKATLGLHGVKYNTYMQQADEYRKEMEKLQEALNADPHNQDLLDRYDDLKEKQRDLIKNAKDEKDAIKDLVEDGINAELDALQKLINKYSDLLDNNKDLYDYQKQLEEAQKNIASLEKQLTAYQGDNSEEGQSKRQQISNDLADARQDLEETQYERSIADQKKLLDDLYDDYEEMLNLRLDNIDMLVQDVITNVNAESAGIRETLETVSSNVGYNMTESMNTIWSSANNVITTYGDKFSTQLTGVLQAINDLKNLLQQQVDAANKKAQTNTTAAKKPSTSTNKPATKPSTNTNTNQNTPQGNGKVEIGDAVKFLSGSYYYSSDGQTPTGDEMHGQTVYITHINTASWAKKQYHIARDKAGNRPLGWVDISQISGYKNGTDHVPYDQLATVAEDGAEGVVHADGRLEKVKALSQSDAVINNKSFRNLLNFSANPVEVLRDAILGNQVIPKDFIDVSTPVAPVTNNVTANNTFNFEINVDKPNNYDEFYGEVMTRFQKDIKAEKVVQHMTFGQLNGKGKLEKYKPQF